MIVSERSECMSNDTALMTFEGVSHAYGVPLIRPGAGRERGCVGMKWQR